MSFKPMPHSKFPDYGDEQEYNLNFNARHYSYK